MIDCVSDIAVIVMEMICYKLFYESFYDENTKSKKRHEFLYIAGLSVVIYIAAIFLYANFVIKQIVIIFLLIFITLCFEKTHIGKTAVLATLFQGLLILVDYGVYIILYSTEPKQGVVNENVGRIVVVLGKVVLFLCVLLVRKTFKSKKADNLEEVEWLRFLIFPLTTVLTIITIVKNFESIENETQAKVLYVVALSMAIMNLVVFFMISDILKRSEELNVKRVMEIQMKEQAERYQIISDNYEKQKRKSHEFKNHIMCIESLVRSAKYEKLQEYVKEINGDIYKENNIINTNHTIINSILNTKYVEAMKKNIVIVFRVNDLSKIKLDDKDIVVLLSNVLSNAIEACEKCDEHKVIKLKFVVEEENLILSVRNRNVFPVQYSGDEIVSSKVLENDEHGYGIKNVKHVVKKYNGVYVIKNENEEFVVSIMIPL